MYKKILTVLILFMILTCSYSFIIVQAETLGEQKEKVEQQTQKAQQKLEYVQGELSEAVLKIQELDDNIREAEEDINNLDNELTDLQTKINEATIKYKNLQESYDKNEALLEQRIVVIYELGDVSYLEVLFQSANIIDFLSNYYTIGQIIQSDVELLQRIEKEKDESEKIKNELDEQKKELNEKRAKKEQLAIINQNNKTLKAQAIVNLSEEEIKLQEQIEKYKAEAAQIEAFIRLASDQYIYTGDYTGGIMAWPVAKSGTYITSSYGQREHPIQGVVKLHSGIDIGNAGYGAPVIAAADGVVTMAGRYGGYGNCVMISHGNGISTLYGHGQTILTEVGKTVKKGDLIMEVGSTGESTGPHLHFEVRINGKCTDPMPYLTGKLSNSEDNENTNTIKEETSE